MVDAFAAFHAKYCERTNASFKKKKKKKKKKQSWVPKPYKSKAQTVLEIAKLILILPIYDLFRGF